MLHAPMHVPDHLDGLGLRKLRLSSIHRQDRLALLAMREVVRVLGGDGLLERWQARLVDSGDLRSGDLRTCAQPGQPGMCT